MGGLLLFALLGSSIPGAGATGEVSLEAAARLRDSGRWEDAASMFKEIWNQAKGKGSPDAGLAYGRVCILQENWKEAIAPLQDAAACSGDLQIYARFQLAVALNAAGMNKDAEKTVQDLLSRMDLPRDMKKKVLFLGARTARELKKRKREITRLRLYIRMGPSRSRREEATFQLARTLESLHRYKEAFENYKHLYYKGSLYGHSAEKEMRRLEKKKGYRLSALSEYWQFRYIRSWMKNGRAADAWEELERMKHRKLTSGGRLKYDFYRVECLYALRDNYEAVAEAEEMAKKHKPGSLVNQALMDAAWCSVREGDHDKVQKLTRKILSSGAKKDTRVSALFTIGLSAYTLGLFDEARHHLETVLPLMKSRDRRRQSVKVMIAWCVFMDKKYAEAAEAFEDAGGEGKDQTDLNGACRYWQARCLMRTPQDAQRGVALMEDLADSPAGYWADRANAWLECAGLRRFINISRLKTQLWPTSIHTKETSLAWRLALCGLDNDASALFYPYYKDHRDDPGTALTMARLYSYSGNRWLAERVVDRIYQDVMKQRYLPPRLAGILYTTPYRTKILSACKAGKVQPNLAFAVIRNESAFNRTACSYTGARGLMQLMPETADRLAKKLKVEIPSPEALYEPALNLKLGVHHLSALTSRFPLAAALSAYNAGEKVTGRWLNSFEPGSEEQFVAMIPYSETRGYCEKILLDRKRYDSVLSR